MPFRDAYDLDGFKLELPIGGKLYTIPPILGPAGARLQLGLTPGSDTAITDAEFRELTLGTALAEMTADRVPPDIISRAAITSMTFTDHGRAIAEIVWETNALPEAMAAWRAANNSPASTPSPSTDGAARTPRRARTRATTSLKATPRKTPASKAASTRGSKSLTTGN